MKCCKTFVAILIFSVVAFSAYPQQNSRSARLEKTAMKRSGFVTGMFPEWSHTGGIRIDSIRVSKDSRQADLYFSPSTSQMPLRQFMIAELRNRLRNELGNRFKKYNINLWVRGRLIDEFVPNAYRDQTIPADPMRFRSRYDGIPLVSRDVTPDYEKGLSGCHIALWPSHGFFFDQQLDRWQWQRARLWQTVEDIFPWVFTSTYLIPMLENAGANVLLPRERDIQVNETLVDNDFSKGSGHLIINAQTRDSIQTGFKWSDTLFPSQNPFLDGTSLSIKVTPRDTVSVHYIPEIPETGQYAVYVSYARSPVCISKVPYIVNHSGGSETFYVNQCMGYGTWVYLGTFRFVKGLHPDSASVVLKGVGMEGVLSTDAVRFGGGMGNVARRPGKDLISRQRSIQDGLKATTYTLTDTINYTWKLSGKPRWMEGSRYYLQFAGMPDTVTYSLNDGKNDYNDDYMSRPEWVNFLIGPSKQQYSTKYRQGLNIPVDLSLAFHTDAGVTPDDSIIGTLGIYSTTRNNGLFPDGRTKMASRDFTDVVQTQIVSDLQQTINPDWTRRGLWDREYSEAWRPVVPSMLLELLSHQNLSDMRYGLDPRFQFIASRAIYKGILRYLASEQQRDVVVQPLPPDNMAIEVIEGKKIKLSWQPVYDPLEVTAKPAAYLVYRRKEDLGFAPPVKVNENFYITELEEWNTIYSFHVSAVNEGGESMSGETLSVSLQPGKDPVLIVNAFDRLSAPAFFDKSDMAGIAWWEDEGVPYKASLSFSGYQYNFDRNSEWLHDDSQGWGASHADKETVVVAGNTFDFPFIHGKAIRNSGYSFVSVSDEVFENPGFRSDVYKVIDIILGEERGTGLFKGDTVKDFRVFTPAMIESLRRYTAKGGNLVISGAYIGTDMVENNDSAAIRFAADVLHFIWRSNHASAKGGVIATDHGASVFPSKIKFNTEFGPGIYRVESPDAIEPVGNGAFSICRYESGSTNAGVAYRGTYKTVALGFPFETIISEEDRNEVMKRILEFLK